MNMVLTQVVPIQMYCLRVIFKGVIRFINGFSLKFWEVFSDEHRIDPTST